MNKELTPEEALAKIKRISVEMDKRGTLRETFEISNKTMDDRLAKAVRCKLKPTPRFTSSMDACIKWVWPYFWKIEMDTIEGVLYKFRLSRPENPDSPVVGELDENPAMAFCLAADKYFEEVSK